MKILLILLILLVVGLGVWFVAACVHIAEALETWGQDGGGRG